MRPKSVQLPCSHEQSPDPYVMMDTCDSCREKMVERYRLERPEKVNAAIGVIHNMMASFKSPPLNKPRHTIRTAFTKVARKRAKKMNLLAGWGRPAGVI